MTRVWRSRRPGWRVGWAASAASLLGHSLLLLGLGRLYERAGTAVENIEPVGRAIAYVPIPRILSTPSAPLLPGALLGGSNVVGDGAEASPPKAYLDRPPADSASAAPPTAIPSAGAEATPNLRGPAGSLRNSGFRDSRLHAAPHALRPSVPARLQDRFDRSFRQAMRASGDSVADEKQRALAKRQTTVLGRRITLFGDSANAHWRRFVIGNERVTLPIDGREWQDLQMKKQRDGFVRDSVLRDRARATRARREAERQRDPR